jgi:hypothetical protein
MIIEPKSKHCGPAWKDTINANRLTHLVETDAELASWLEEKLATEQGRVDLNLLLSAARFARQSRKNQPT